MKKTALLLVVIMLFSVLSVPVFAAEEIIYTTADANYTEEGVWKTTTNPAVVGYPGVPSRYISSEGSAQWVPKFKQGTYKVKVYKTVHPSSLYAQIFEICHHGKIDYAVVDFTRGEKGWAELGTFDFWGDGDDYIKTWREDGGAPNKVARLSAVSFELVSEIKDPIPSPKPEIIKSEMPEIGEDVPDETEIIAKPEKVGDVMVIPAENSLYCKQKGEWAQTNAAPGYNSPLSYYCSSNNGSFIYTPYMPAGKYKVEIFKTVHANSLKDQTYEIKHMGTTDTVVVDHTAGTSEWTTLGEYDFWGNGRDTVSVTKTGGDITPIRNSAIRFTLLSLSGTPAPVGLPDPATSSNIEMDIPALPITGDGIKVLIDNVLQKYDQPPVTVNDRTLVPLRGIFEALGAQVFWSDETETVTAMKDKTVVALKIGDTTATKDGATIVLDVPAQLINDRTLVPVRFVSEAFGNKVDWDESTQTVSIQTGKETEKNLFVSPKAFTEMGTWTMESSTGAFDGNLKGKPDETGEYEPAVAKVNIAEAGKYQIFVHARDYSTNQPGTRFFGLALNGETVPKTFGQHGSDGFRWEKAGIFDLKQGELAISLLDTSTFYARCDGVYITKDLKMKTPPATYEKVLASAKMVGDDYSADAFYPEYAKTTDAPIAENTISSDRVKLTFYTVKTPVGNVIQKEMAVGGEVTTSRENTMGALLMYAKEAEMSGSMGQFPVYKATFNKNGTETTAMTGDVYKIGEPSWLIPSEIEVIDNKTVLLKASNSYANATFKVTVKDGESEPVVTFTLYPKKEGYFVANIQSGAETKEFSYAFAPFRFNGTVLPTESTLVSEAYATVPMAMKTVKNGNGKDVTVGIAIDKDSVPLEWPKVESAKYGFSLRGPNGGAAPSLAAPLYTSEQSKMKAGDSYSITYRIIESFGEWYPVYKHFAQDIYGLTDYRRNYFATLNDAIFNTTDLANSDKAGWDDGMLGYYNIEAKNTVTQSNPLVFMSTYLLTEDKDFLERRTIPTLAYLLTRPGFHYSNGDLEGGTANYGGVTPIGTACKNYGSAVYGGGYLMSEKLMTPLKEIGIDKGLVSVDTYGTAPKYQEYLWLYKYTNDKSYLEKAETEAKKFIENQIDAPRSVRFNEEMFIAINFYPQFFGLIDLYEVTQDKQYLDAAVKAAYNLLPTVWIYPNSGDEDYTVSADYVRETRYAKNGGPRWYGKIKYTPGEGEYDKLQDQTLPFWTVSRAGLSLEQTFTYTMHGSGNMIMASWAPDLMRLAEYSGDPIFETYARNAVVGRHTTYSGYYYNNYFAYQQNKDYPFEGPDITGIYWHHMQPFLAMLQDFLFTQAWNWSNQKINFPSVRNSGYAYFSNRMYGGESGKFYDEDNMWLWLKKGIVTTDNVQLDWVAARKDGVAAIGFMNEDTAPQSAAITLGDVLSGYTGEATVFDADGNTSALQITDGKAEITVPGRTILSIKIQSDAVKAPEYSTVQINEANAGKQTVSPKDGETDFGYVLQMSGDEYFAYVGISEGFEKAEKAVLHYKVGNGAWQTMDDTYAPFEFIVKVTDPKASFTYYVEKVIDGKTIKSSEKTLTPMTK